MIWIGISLLAVGLIVRFWSIRTMGRDFSEVIRAPQHLVFSGPFRFVRHPVYVGHLFVLGGLAILCAPVAIVYLAYAFYKARAIAEELILAHYPGYIDYAMKTGQFCPRLWRRHHGRTSVRTAVRS